MKQWKHTKIKNLVENREEYAAAMSAKATELREKTEIDKDIVATVLKATAELPEEE